MSEKKKAHIEKIREIFPQTSIQDIEELLGQYNNDVTQVISRLTQRSEEYSWTEVKKKKTPKPPEQKQRKQGKPRTDSRRNQNPNFATNNQNSNLTPKPSETIEPESNKPRQTETPDQHAQQTQQHEGYRQYGRGRGRPYSRPEGGYGRGRGFSAQNGAPRYPSGQRYPNPYRAGYHQSNQYSQSATYDQTAPTHQAEVLGPDQISPPAPPVEELPKVLSETSGEDTYPNETENSQVSTEDHVTTSLEELNLQGSQFNQPETSSPISSSSEREPSSHSPVTSESKSSKTSPGQSIPAHQRTTQKPTVQRWKVKESPSPTNVPLTPNLQSQEDITPSAPQHTQSSPEPDHSQEHYVQQSQTPQPQSPPTSVPTQTSQVPQPPDEPSESETSPIGSPTSTAQPSLQTSSHEPPQPLSQIPNSQQNTSQPAPVSASHSVGSVPLQQPTQQAPTSPQTSLPPNPSTRSKVVILPTGLRNEEQVAFKFGNIPMMYGDSKPSLPLPDEHGLSLGDMSYKSAVQPHRDVHGLQDYHAPEPELQEPIAQVPYPYVPYVFPYMEDGSQDVQRMARMGMPQPYYEPYLGGFRQSIDPKPYPVNRGSPISGSVYGSRDKYHADSSNSAQPNPNSNPLSQQPQTQTGQSQQISQQQAQQAQQPPPTMLPQYYNSPQLYGYSYFPGQYQYQGMPTTHYPYLGRNFGYYKPTPGAYPNYASSAYAPGTMGYEDEYKYMNMAYNPSFFAPEGLTGASISSSKTSPVGTGSAAPGQNTQHLGGASHVSKGQSAYPPNSPGTPATSQLGPEKSGSEFKNYSPSGRDASSFYQALPTQLPYYQNAGYPAPNRMIQPQHHHHHHLHQPTATQGQSPQQSQGVQGQQTGSTQGAQPTGQQPQTRPPQSQ